MKNRNQRIRCRLSNLVFLLVLFSCWVLQDFVDASRQTKWCPHAACGKVVSYITKGGGASERSEVNVECEDGHTFCWLVATGGLGAPRGVCCLTGRHWILPSCPGSAWRSRATSRCPVTCGGTGRPPSRTTTKVSY